MTRLADPTPRPGTSAAAGPARRGPSAASRTPLADHDFAALLDRLLDRRALDEAEAEGLMDDVLAGGLGPERLAAFVTAMRAKGVVVAELVGFARSLRTHAHPVDHPFRVVLDTCGTGGAPRKSFNVSTAAAFVVAAAGIPVAKHGNRSVTRPSGSADVLERAGARLDLAPPQAAHVLRNAGIAFLFAPTFHPAMQHAAPVRRALGIRTVFNLLGPLANPAGATHQVLGVHDAALLRPMADALARLGGAGFIVHSEPGYDEAMPTGLVRSVQVKDGAAGPVRTLDPASLGLAPCAPAEVAPVPTEASVRVLHEVLAGTPGPRSDAVALNAAFALVATHKARTLQDGLAQALALQRAGTARAKLDAFVAATRSA